MIITVIKPSLSRTPVRHPVLCLLVGYCLLFAGGPVRAVDWLKPLKVFGDEEEIVVWQGPGIYVKIVEQDRFKRYERPPKNEHPAAIGATDIAAVLASLKTGKDGSLFTSGEIAQVAPKLAEALGRVQPRQDVIFAVSDAQGKSGRRITAARAFVEAGQLNIILGDTLQPGGESAPQIIDHRESPWRPGRRRETLDSSQPMGGGPGISFRPGARSPREDWAIIEVRTLAAAYRGPQIPLATAAAAAPAEGAAVETNAQLLQERQQMRLEMARMRKQLDAQPGAATEPAAPPAPQPAAPTATPTAAPTAAPADIRASSPAPTPAPAPAGTQSVEQRLSTLQSLHEKKLITDEEYAAKKKKILDEL